MNQQCFIVGFYFCEFYVFFVEVCVSVTSSNRGALWIIFMDICLFVLSMLWIFNLDLIDSFAKNFTQFKIHCD